MTKAGRLGNDISSIMLYVDKTKGSPCWIWWGASLSNGYGKVTVNYKTLLVHRFVYESLIGPIPEGLQLDHVCENKLCVNPAHLEPVTCKINMERRSASKTHCINGHPYIEENIYIRKDGRRQCRVCSKLYWGK